MIEFAKVTKQYGEKKAVDSLDLSLEKGYITMLIGPSGCGKTTTLKMINRLVEPDSGDITINGTSIWDLDPVTHRRAIGYVIQEVGLFPHYSVYDNIALLPRLHQWKEDRIRNRVYELLDLVTLDETYADTYPLQLSGGERQRVGLARALAADPEVLLMDEPFGAIDPINRLVLQESFLEIQEEIRKTIVFVTHDINEAIKLGDRIVVLNQGSLVQHDEVAEILDNPADEFVEELLGHDRNLKALSLKRVRRYLASRDDYTVVSPEDTPEIIMKMLKAKKRRMAYIVDSREIFRGVWVIDRNPRKKTEKLVKVERPVYAETSTSVTEALSRMLEAGEKELPVVRKGRIFAGLVKLGSIFEEVEEARAASEEA
ncbi:MAG TPA: ABC transporter ATP-binding protein [Synergistaceae bacterium]|nr:ABC transporter ATP-binding protein [Synergistaceae bacterium]HPJ25406.1 ABC transporter ATP-binding protein [Synergistaceae bacterium]HPQ36925.1 ABC transporter ATP-binding protein [Synergistaceae bacterium]